MDEGKAIVLGIVMIIIGFFALPVFLILDLLVGETTKKDIREKGNKPLFAGVVAYVVIVGTFIHTQVIPRANYLLERLAQN